MLFNLIITELEVLKKEIGNPVYCEVCEYAMQYLDSILGDKATQAEVEAALDKLCNYLPSSLEARVCFIVIVLQYCL